MVTAFTGCAATAEKKPHTQSESTASAAPPSVTPIAPPSPAPVQVNSNNQIAEPDTISRIQSQLTALQEQVIKLSGDTAAILQLSQLAVANGQIAQSSSNMPAKNSVRSQPKNGDSLKNILTKLEDISPSPQASFGIVSSYTASKQWVLIRFDRYTGETWLADNSGWNALTETGDLEISQYDVHLIRADQDKKGFVASRIDQRTGDTWWLNKDQWVVYQ